MPGGADDTGTIVDESEVIHVPLSEERIRIEKDVVPTEEILIGKRSITKTEHVSETLRKEVLDVENSR